MGTVILINLKSYDEKNQTQNNIEQIKHTSNLIKFIEGSRYGGINKDNSCL